MRCWSVVALSCACAALAACAPRAPETAPQSAPTVGPLAAVSPVPAPSLPPWIAEISPTQTADENAQIRVRFASDIVPVTDLAATDKGGVLDNFVLDPQLPGRFILYTPRLVAFQADVPLPLASRFRVTLRAGLHDTAGHRLDSDLAWTFDTTPADLSGLPAAETGETAPTVDLQPHIALTASVELDRTSLAAHAELRPIGAAGANAPAIPLTVEEPSPTPSPLPQDNSDATGRRESGTFSYSLTPAAALAAATTYRVAIAPGVKPLVGNVETAKTFSGRIETRGPLRFVGSEPYERPIDNSGVGRFVSGVPQLNFSNGLDAKSATAAVHVSPSPRGLNVEVNDGDTSIRIGSAALAPNTRYAITVDGSVRDIFGQTLGQPVSTTFTTTNLAADIWAPSGTTVFPSARNLQLNVYTTNLNGSFDEAFRVIQPTDFVDSNDPSPAASGSPSLTPDGAATKPVTPPVRHNIETIQPIPLRAALGGATGTLSYAVSAFTNQYRNDAGKLTFARPQFYGLVQLTNLGVFAQWFPHYWIVRVNHLADGSPVAGAQIAIYGSRIDDSSFGPGKRPPPEACATGTADASGALALDGAAFSRCTAISTSATDAPALLVVARSGADWTTVRTWPWSGAYDQGLNGGWSAGQPESRGAFISDRSLYQQGETAYFSGLAYFVTNGVLGRAKASSYDLTVEAPGGSKRKIGTAKPDRFGVFAVTLPLARNAELGDYTIRAQASNGEELDGSFRVAEFKPPNFKVALTLDRAFAEAGGSVQATAQSDYLFGAPVSGGRARIDVTRERTYFSPAGWDSWEFGRVWSYPEQEPSVPPDVLQRDLPVDANGRVRLDVPVGTDLPYAMAYRVDAQTTDVANIAVSDSKSFTALPSPALIGLSADFVGASGTALPVQVDVVDAQGKAIAGKAVHLALERRVFARATQIVEGGETPQETVSYAKVDEGDVTSGEKPQKLSLTPKDPGEYRVRATFAGATDESSATDHTLWVAGPGEADWGGSSSTAVAVKLDKATYKPGDIATAVVASPYAHAELEFSVIRNGVLYHERRIVDSAAPQVHFKVTAAMLPNAAVEALLVRRGPLPADATGQSDLARVGFAAFATALDSRTLKVSIAPANRTLLPGAQQRVHVRMVDAGGHGAAGELALMVVNDAVLQLTGYRPPDLVATVYAEQSISTRYGDSRADVVLSSPERPVEKGYGYGGGFLAGAGSTRIRTNFRPVAYFNGAVHTDANGDADVNFALPDDLTTWRVMALAFTADARFGNGESTFITTKPLIANPVLPQFARPGDRFDGGVSIVNTAKGTGSLDLRAQLAGGLQFAQSSGQTQSLTQTEPAPAAIAAFRFPITVTGAQDGSVQFGATLAAANDAFRVPLPVRTNDIMENVVSTGATRADATVPVVVSAGVPADAGGIDVHLGSSIVPDIAEALRAALADDTTFGDGLVARIDVEADALLLARTYRAPEKPAVRDALARAIVALSSQRAPDGGIAPWPNADHSDPYLDAAAFTALAHAKAAGQGGAADQVAHLRTILERTLQNPGVHKGYGDEPERSSVRLATLAALADDGEMRSDFLGQIVAQDAHLALSEQYVLARLLAREPVWQQRAKTMAASLQQDIAQTAHAAGVVTSYDGVAAQAGALRLFAATHESTDLIDKAATSLIALQSDGRWGCGCSDAIALDALVAYAALQPVPPDFTVNVRVGNAAPRSFAFHGYAMTEASLRIPMSDVPRGTTNVVVSKSGEGTLRYAVAYRYRISPGAPGRYHGLRLDRFVRTAGATDPLATFGLAVAPPLHVAPGGVYEIEDRIITDHPVNRVVIVDPIPAGMEAVDTSFATASQAIQARTDSWDIDYQHIYFDRIEAYASRLDAGVYALRYLVRSVTPGTFSWPAGTAQLERAPDEFGRTGPGELIVGQ